MIPKLNAHTGLDGCRKIGFLRICFAATCVIERLLLGLDLDFFFSSTNGVLPMDRQERGIFGLLNVALRGMEDDTYLYAVHWMGLLNAALLMLGVAPRLNVFLLYCNTCASHQWNSLVCDGHYNGVCTLARIFSFLFIFLPLHHITIWDRFGFERKYHTICSWSMWPVWLFQWQSVLVMAGAMVGKFDGEFWLKGQAMYYVSSCTDEGVGIFNPDIVFNRVLPSKILTWSALAIEIISPFTIWSEKTRIPTLMMLASLFFGIDLGMNMGMFEIYNMIGWSFFLIKSETFENPKALTSLRAMPALLLRLIGYVWFVIHLVSAFAMAFPLERGLSLSPAWLNELASPVEKARILHLNRMEPLMDVVLDIAQVEWTLFDGTYDGTTTKMAINVTLTDASTREWRSVDWNVLPKWKRKRYYNFMNYLKHVGESRGVDEEQELFLEKIAEDVILPSGLPMESVTLFTYEEYPPPYPKHLGWFHELNTEELIVGSRQIRLNLRITEKGREELLGRKVENQTWFYDLFEEVSDSAECPLREHA